MRTEDGYIIHKCLNGESGAFGILVDKYKAGIFAFAYDKLGSFQDAEDVTQEVFERAYRNLHSLRRWESFASWLYRIASNQCKRRFQVRSRRPDSEFTEEQAPKVFEKLALDAYRDSRIDESLRESLDSLSSIYREVLILHYFGGLTIKDIARAIGASPTAIGVRLSRARAQLKEEMVTMMDTIFEGQRLQASFTFRIVESVKRMKIHPTPRTAGLPWGVSIAAGIILAVLSLSPRLGLPVPMPAAVRPSLSGEAKVLEMGEIAVDVLKISQIPAIAGKNEDAGLPPLQNAPALAPQGETTFTEVSEEAGITDQVDGYSAAFVDYDSDGDLDVHVSNWGGHAWPKEPDKLYRNNGDGTFTDVAEETGILIRQSWTVNTIFGDYDNDGDVDLYLVNATRNTLYRNNGDNTFTDVTMEAGVGDTRDGKIGVFWDYDNDGHLDIYATTWGKGSVLCKNNGDGTFTDVSGKVGTTLPSGFHSAAVGDYDNDGDLDLFAQHLSRNNGDGTFTNVVKESGIPEDNGRGGVTLGDYDNDGHLDVCIVDGWQGVIELYKNNGDGTFTDVTQKAGVANTTDNSPPVFVDYDNDGYLDLYVMDDFLYRNSGDGTFDNVIEDAGIESKAAGVPFHNGTSFGDYDNDGDMDLFLPRARSELFRNNGNDNHWLHIKTVGTQSNRDGIGARVTVKAGDLSQIRDVVSECARRRPPVQFGLGKNAVADEIEIKWPSGQVTTLTNVGADQMIQVTEGEEGYKVLHKGGQIGVKPARKQLGTWGEVKKTTLLQNFPNPFNPETWIPYQLAQEEDIAIKVYSASGQLVRTLNIGRKPTGAYTSKERAAHWDGTNSSGEQVASNVYFYTIQAGDFTATKKMVVAR